MARHSATALPDVREQILHECTAMAAYALASGMRLPPGAAAVLEQARAAATGGTAPLDVTALARLHDQLSRAVAPATPRALLLMGPDHSAAGGLRAMLGSVGLVRRMMLAAVVSMLIYIVVGLSPDVNAQTRTVTTASGLPLLLNELAWLSSAAMGASFAMLMQVSGYVVKRNYDPRYESTYWIKFFLGVMAGFILVQVAPIGSLGGADPNLTQLLIALVGGFSASAVFRILTRLVDTVESLFRGDAKEEATRRENEARARAAEEASQARVGLAARIVGLQQQISTGADPEALTTRLQEILRVLVPDPSQDTASPEPASAPPPQQPEGTIALGGVTVVSAPEAEDAPPAAASAPSATEGDAPEAKSASPAAPGRRRMIGA